MKKNILISLICFVSVAMSAQSVDFNGNWKLNSSKSKLNEQFSMAPGEMKIVQKGNDLTIEKHAEFQGQAMVTNDKFSLDGKETINPGFMDAQKKSIVSWSEDKKSLKITSKIAMNDGNEIVITEVYLMEGGNLVIKTASSSSFGDMAETQVYDKI